MSIIHDTTIPPLYICLKSTDYTTLNNQYNSSITFELYRSIYVENNVDIWLQVESFKFTNSIYNVNVYNNIFYYGLAGSAYAMTSATIPRGNYNTTTLLTVLNSIGNGFIFTFDEITTSLIITNSQNFKLYPSTNNILRVIGFSNVIQSSVLNSIQSDQMINLIGPQMLYLSLPNISINSYSIRNSSSNIKSVISSVPISSIQGDTQIYSSSLRHNVKDKIITHLQVKITDEDDNEVNFNGVPWFLNLSFIFSYKKQFVKPTYLSDLTTVDESLSEPLDSSNSLQDELQSSVASG
jgi:hypothetical protein